MTDDRILDAMSLYGGSFVSGLAALYRRGDAHNQARLKAAFPEYWALYADLASRREARAAADASALFDRVAAVARAEGAKVLATITPSTPWGVDPRK